MSVRAQKRWEKGYRAYLAGVPRSANTVGVSASRFDWAAGWLEAQAREVKHESLQPPARDSSTHKEL